MNPHSYYYCDLSTNKPYNFKIFRIRTLTCQMTSLKNLTKTNSKLHKYYPVQNINSRCLYNTNAAKLDPDPLEHYSPTWGTPENLKLKFQPSLNLARKLAC